MRSIAAAAAFASASAVFAGAQAQPLKLDELVAQALHANPEILAAQKRYEAARQRPTQESTLPDPMLSLGYHASCGPVIC